MANFFEDSGFVLDEPRVKVQDFGVQLASEIQIALHLLTVKVVKHGSEIIGAGELRVLEALAVSLAARELDLDLRTEAFVQNSHQILNEREVAGNGQNSVLVLFWVVENGRSAFTNVFHVHRVQLLVTIHAYAKIKRIAFFFAQKVLNTLIIASKNKRFTR